MSHPREVTDTTYEWDYESLDEYGDIIDHNFFDKCPGLPDAPLTDFVLVKNVGKGLYGHPLSFDLYHRAWAYIVDGKLPDEFDDGSKVPQKLRKEFESALKIQRAERGDA